MPTVSGTFLRADGTPSSGSVAFAPSVAIGDHEEVRLPSPQEVHLDNTGSFTIDIPATDDPRYTPAGWVWQVKERVPGGRPAWHFELTADADYWDLNPIIPPEPIERWVLTTDPRLDNARTPTAHAASHATAGTDPLTAANIGAVPASAYTANSLAFGDATATVSTLSVAASRIVGRAATGSVAALTSAQARTVLGLATTDAPTFARVRLPFSPEYGTTPEFSVVDGNFLFGTGLSSLASGMRNVAIGAGNLDFATSGDYNVAIGLDVLNGPGNYNGCVGIGTDSTGVGAAVTANDTIALGTPLHAMKCGAVGTDSGLWAFGVKKTAPATFDTTGHITVKVDGITYKLALVA